MATRKRKSSTKPQNTASIQEFGWTNLVLADEARQSIAGHGRVLTASRPGQDQVPMWAAPHV